MKKILLSGLVVLALLVGAVLVVPGFVDWNAYKGEIAARLGAMTGRAVELEGDLRLSLLPHPALTVTDARVASLPGAEEPEMMRLKRLDVQVALMPLLGGRVQVESVTLVEPTIVFEVLADGRFNWDLGGAAAPRQPMGGDGFAAAVSFDRVAIENGSILYRDAQSGRYERIENVHARVVAGSLAGPFQVEGRFVLRGVPMTGELTAGRFADGAAVPLRVSVALPDTDATMRFAGIVDTGRAGGKAGGKEGLRAQGDLRAEGSDAARVIGALGGAEGAPPPGAFSQPFSLRSTVEASAGAVGFGALELQIGDTRATGSASLRPQQPAHVDLALAVNRLDLDGWLQRAAAAPPPPPPGNRGSTADGAAPGASEVPGFVLPEGLSARIDLAADGVTYNGGVVRQARLEASLSGGLLAIDRLSALLPGGSDMVAAGSLTAANGRPVIDLRMEANADNLRGLLEWLKFDVAAVPADRLRKASLAVHVAGRPERVEVTGLDLRVDTSRMTGAVTYIDRGKPAFGVRLDVDRLNLDAYRPARPASGEGSGDGAGGPPALPPPPVLERMLRGVDANLELTVGNLVAGGVPVDGLTLAASASNGKLTVRDAGFSDLAGVAAEITGQIDSMLPPRGLHLAVTARAQSLSGLPRLVGWPAGAPTPEQLGPVTLQGILAGNLDSLSIEMSADAAGGTAEVGGTVTGPPGRAAADLKVRATHPELARLVGLFAEGGPASLGPLDLYAELSGTAEAFSVSGIQGIVAGTAVKGEATVDRSGPRPRVETELQTGALDLTRLAAGPVETAAQRPPATGGQSAGPDTPTGEDDGFAWMRMVDGRLGLTSAAVATDGVRLENVALAATLEEGVLTLEQLDGGLYDGQLGATGRFAAPADGLPGGELDVTVVKAKLDHAIGGGAIGLGGGTLDLDVALKTTGRDGEAMLRALSGEGRLAVRDGVLRGFDLGALRERLTARLDKPQDVLEAVLRGLQGGETRFARLDGTFRISDGVARTEDVRLVSAIGEATAAGQVDLPERSIDMRVRVEPDAGGTLPPVTVRLTGPLAQPTRSFEMAELQDFIARRAAGAVLEKAVPGGLPLPVPGLGGGRAEQPQDVIRGLIEGLRR
ncbi:AsmA family protein [Azospirillum sp. ST 5-10]|uniref:AsmA family protein n=1 Tax=unclassified Azospirillum TaxID=2630922 RepID=UPI003F4A5378